MNKLHNDIICKVQSTIKTEAQQAVIIPKLDKNIKTLGTRQLLYVLSLSPVEIIAQYAK